MQHYSSTSVLETQPMVFDKKTDKDLLSYALGANLYMPAMLSLKTLKKIQSSNFCKTATMTFCLEDSVSDEDLPIAESTLSQSLTEVFQTCKSFDYPLLFVRVRGVKHFSTLVKKLSSEQLSVITGFIFPKFDSNNGNEYFEVLNEVNKRIRILDEDNIIYAMPILESPSIIHIETRQSELFNIRNIVDNNKEFVLNIRTGGTDFSAVYGVRRTVEHTIYDIQTVSNCILDIVNVFHRNLDYIVSGPVWEHFPKSEKVLLNNLRQTPFSKKGLKNHRDFIFEKAIDGLIKECLLDIANGLNGKTTIHPSHVAYINSLHIVNYEDYMDALSIKKCANSGGGVMKGSNGGKMSEINPHQNWANNILYRSQVYGVYKEDKSFIDVLFDMNILNDVDEVI